MRIAALLSIVLAAGVLLAQETPRIQFQSPPPSLSGTRIPDGAVRVPGGVMMGLLTKKVQPSSVPCGVSGAVVMHAIVGTDGKIERLTLISGRSDALNRAAMDAARQWEFKPYMLNGNPVRVDTTIVEHIDVNGCPANAR